MAVTAVQDTEDGLHAPSATDPGWFPPALVGIVLVGLLVRVLFAVSAMSVKLSADARFFHNAAAGIADGKGYLAFSNAAYLKIVETAGHPPLFPLLLAFFDVLGLRSTDAQRVALAVVASSGVLVMGLLGRMVIGPAGGLVAAGIAAFDPLWFQTSGILMSESIYLVVIPTMLLFALSCIEKPESWRFGLLGMVIGLAVLIRSESIDFIVILSIPVLLFSSTGWRRRLASGAVVLAGFALVLTPWLVRNELQLGGFVLSDNGGTTLAGSYCPATFDSRSLTYGSFDIQCVYLALNETRSGPPPKGSRAWSDLSLNDALTSASIRYGRTHIESMPRVVLAREASAWGFGNPGYQQVLSTAEGRIQGWENVGRILYWGFLPFVTIGLVSLARRSRQRLVIVTVPIAVVALNVALFYGSTRMRIAAEPSLAILTAAGLFQSWEWLRSAFRSRQMTRTIRGSAPRANTPPCAMRLLLLAWHRIPCGEQSMTCHSDAATL